MASAELKATRVDRASLPVIDISDLEDRDPNKRQVVAKALRSACLDNGFFYIANHGIPQSLTDNVFKQAAKLFDLPMAQKLALDLDRSPCRHGYEPLKRQTLEQGAPADLKEGFYIGRESADAALTAEKAKSNYGPNQWPQGLPDFQPVMERYHALMLQLSERLMRGIALSLGLEERHFDAFCHDPLARLRLLHYPSQPSQAAAGEKGAGAHTDYGGITVLLQDDCGGLQVKDQTTGQWIHADPVPGTFVVNLGDMIARWTNDRYRSTLHRVVNASGRERYSIPFFFHGNLDHVVACIPTCLDADGIAKYPVTTVSAHFQERLGQSYATA